MSTEFYALGSVDAGLAPANNVPSTNHLTTMVIATGVGLRCLSRATSIREQRGAAVYAPDAPIHVNIRLGYELHA